MTWATANLGELTNILSGFAFKSSRFGTTGDLPIVRIRDVVPARSSTYYSGDYDEKFLVENGDLLIGMDGEFNRQYWSGGTALLNQRVCKITSANDHLDTGYLYYWLPKALKDIEDKTPFVTVKHLSAKTLKEQEIPLPPLEEQRRIAGILDAADALRRRRREALALLDTLPGAIFAEMFGDEPDTAGEWPMKKFGDLVADNLIGLVRGAKEISPDLPVPYLKMDSITRTGRVDLDKLVAIEASPQEIEKYSVAPGDLLFNTRNTKELVGKSAVYFGPEGVVINNNVMRIRATPETSPDFISGYLRSPFGYRQLEQRKSGTTSVFAVYAKSLMTLPVPVPPRDLIDEYDDRCRCVRDMRDQHVAQQSELETLFASLQSRAFAGEL